MEETQEQRDERKRHAALTALAVAVQALAHERHHRDNHLERENECSDAICFNAREAYLAI